MSGRLRIASTQVHTKNPFWLKINPVNQPLALTPVLSSEVHGRGDGDVRSHAQQICHVVPVRAAACVQMQIYKLIRTTPALFLTSVEVRDAFRKHP